MNIILGSASLQRRAILRQMGYEFEVMPADIDEKSIRLSDPEALTLALAHAKADALLPKLSDDTLLITADQVVFFNNTMLEKPRTPQEARHMLIQYGTKPVYTITAVVVVNTKSKRKVEGVDVATIWFKPFTEELLKEFADSGKAMQHAGGFAAETPLFAPFVERIEGEMESIVGLPLKLTQQLIEEVQ